MWRKITSNRDPRDTLYSELKKEFNPYFGKADNFSRKVFDGNPKVIFSCMIVALLVSGVLAFTVYRHPEPEHSHRVKQQENSIQDGFGQIMQAAGKIRKTLRLKHLVDSISAKKQLSTADSTVLDSALSQLQQIKTIK